MALLSGTSTVRGSMIEYQRRLLNYPDDIVEMSAV